MTTAIEIRALGAKAVAELRTHGGLPALADWIEALNATMDVSDPLPASEQGFVYKTEMPAQPGPAEGMQAQPGTPETDADPTNPNMPPTG